MIKTGFWNGDDEYGQEEFNEYFNNLYRSGVSIDDSGNMTLGVSKENRVVTFHPGFAIVRGFYFYREEAEVYVPALPTNYSRSDRVVLQLNMPLKTITRTVKQGAQASNPVPPPLQRDSNGNIYEISLARYTISSAGEITTLYDERPDQTLCGAIRPKNLTEYNSMVAEFQRRWDAWFTQQQTAGWRNMYVQSTAPTGAVEGSIWLQIPEEVETIEIDHGIGSSQIGVG